MTLEREIRFLIVEGSNYSLINPCFGFGSISFRRPILDPGSLNSTENMGKSGRFFFQSKRFKNVLSRVYKI